MSQSSLNLVPDPPSLRQLRIVVPALAGTALAVVGAIGLNRLWDLNYAPVWGAAALAVGLIGLVIAVVLIAYAYAGHDDTPKVGGQTAQQVSTIINDTNAFPDEGGVDLLNASARIKEMSVEHRKRRHDPPTDAEGTNLRLSIGRK